MGLGLKPFRGPKVFLGGLEILEKNDVPIQGFEPVFGQRMENQVARSKNHNRISKFAYSSKDCTTFKGWGASLPVETLSLSPKAVE